MSRKGTDKMDILKSLKNMAKRYTPVMEMYYFVLSVY